MGPVLGPRILLPPLCSTCTTFIPEVTPWSKMAAGAPAITSHLTNREEEMKNGTPSLSPIRTLPRSYAHKSSYFHCKRNMAELIVWQIGLGNLVFILVATSSAKN